MTTLLRAARRGTMMLAVLALGACSGNTGGLGNILGSVLGGQGAGTGNGSQVSGAIDGIDTRNQQIGLRQSNGQTVGIAYDNNTRVVYQNQNYSVTSLERGDQVTVRIQQNGNSYYTDLVQVDQSVRGGSGTVAGNGQVQSVQGTVRQLDVNNGLFVLDGSDRNQYTVYMGNTVSRADFARFQNLRNGEPVRFYGVFISNTRVELRQFY